MLTMEKQNEIMFQGGDGVEENEDNLNNNLNS